LLVKIPMFWLTKQKTIYQPYSKFNEYNLPSLKEINFVLFMYMLYLDIFVDIWASSTVFGKQTKFLFS